LTSGFSFSQGINGTVSIDALTANSYNRRIIAVYGRCDMSANLGFTAATATGMAQFYADAPTLSGAGTITPAAIYGYYVANQGSAKVNNSYAHYILAQSGSNTASYSIYEVGLGLNRFGDQLDIVGGADRIQLRATGFTTQAVATPVVQFTRNDVTAGISALLGLTALGSGANGDGGSILLNGKSSTTAAQAMGLVSWSWVTALHGSRAAKLSFSAYDTAARLGLEIEASGTAAKLGFFGATTVVQQLAATDLGVALSNLGLRAAGTAYPITTSGAVNLQGVTKLGDGATNYANFTAAGIQSFLGTARIAWTKKTAATATVTDMTTTSNVTDLQTANDGNAYTAVEVASNPNQNLVVGFTSITAFNWVQILGRYQGSSGHGITIQLEITPFDGSAWHTFGLLEDDTSDTNYINYSFFVPSDAAYINSGAVKVRFVHTMNGTAGHELVLDCVALYQ